MVIGEYERAFSGDQFVRVAALLDRLGVRVWLPEAGGVVRLADPMHRALVTVLLGAQSQREVLRSQHRVLAAMRTQAREQGRYLGGRPRTDIGSSMPVHIRIGLTRAADGGCGAWTRIR